MRKGREHVSPRDAPTSWPRGSLMPSSLFLTTFHCAIMQAIPSCRYSHSSFPASHSGTSPSTWTRSSHLGRLMEEAPNNEQMVRENPERFPKGAHASLSRQIVWAEPGGKEKQDGAASNSRDRLWSGSPSPVILVIWLTSVCQQQVRGKKGHCAEVLSNWWPALVKDFCYVNNDHISSNRLHRLILISLDHLSGILGRSVG
jgi:hypothetical protein